MLEQLTIKNVAVIDKLEVSFKSGISVLTGETGAGKSIIIDSINMILGSRANKELVRRGTDKAEVQAVFSMPDSVRGILEENDIDTEDDGVIIRRIVTKEGKSSARVNGAAVNLNLLREIAGMLINIHGQHDNQALLTPEKHISFLDAYAHTAQPLWEYKEKYDRMRAIERRLKALQTDEQAKMQRIDLLSYQVNEISSAKLEPEEEDELLSQRKLLENAEQINECAERAYANLYDYPDGQSAYDMISEAVDAMSEISEMSNELRDAYDAISSAMYAIEDAAHEVKSFSEGIEFDAQALDEVQERLDLINKLKRKYGGTVAEVIKFGERAQEALNDIVTSGEQTERLKEELSAINKQLKAAAAALTKMRTEAAEVLEKEIEKALHELNMEKAVFSVSVKPQAYAANGADLVEFMIATNPGEDLKPLVKIASGGELSRVMLAIKSILAKSDDVDTLIFDEIDTGVSGGAAQKIADKLKTIGESKQVICITHLPQLASAADNHFLIVKDTDGELASTTLEELDLEGRVKELARIVGGGTAGEDYAREMLRHK
ncbi:MAG: DNA repair protein RecN [Candidatus Ornithomonoglobus sp.]